MCLDSIDFSPATVYKTLKRLKSSTSVGPDGLPNVLLKQCSSALAVPLSYIFEISFKDNILPACWKEAHIIPVHIKKAVPAIQTIIDQSHSRQTVVR